MTTYKQMLSTITEDGTLTMELVEQDMPTPKDDEILVKVLATPINPSDHGVMFGTANVNEAANKDGKLVAPVNRRNARI